MSVSLFLASHKHTHTGGRERKRMRRMDRLRTPSLSLRRLSSAGIDHCRFIKATPLRLVSSIPPPSQTPNMSGCGSVPSLVSAGATRCPVRAASSQSAPPFSESITCTGGDAADSRQHEALTSSPCSSAQPTEVPPKVAGDAVMKASHASLRAFSSAAASAPEATMERGTRSGDRPSKSSCTRQAPSAELIGKSKHAPRSDLKIKKKAPWGERQLRDSWSEDAMSKRDRDNMDERIHREYRYHPDEFRRGYIRYTAFLTIPCIMFGMSVTYYYETGRPFWQADLQHLLNLLRVMDTSPRSKLYAYRLADTHDLPAHVLRHRSENFWKREYDERVFRLTRSAFERPSTDALRLMELEEDLKTSEAESEGAALADAATA
ncbi:conserved hypothetical protein [Leishmania infantum JPCM5]|uniref:Uncharacterized protein n=2 Tax=Leishmania infantum TaxID=5671 RepID=A4I0D1_LEIIN|nr:conserved hypothetical protein [Leishmania infantum JPCM5]CAC9489554.1 hypothetical_protein_-_conserved [Leishmania infantum]CAM68199.1 conserved hypothetical protein [Leishmania infantum JPCM5]SUZ41970.1 hypothetical_protein_-_conserved [Leishmania infantum]|eukprot:XP_001465772.1 conserved hypothetical protein [Leishmania infantum JPCM5]